MTISAFVVVSPQGTFTVNRDTIFDLGATGYYEVLQNVGVILSTRIGQVILDRRFGSNQNYVDAPMNAAQLMCIASICVAVTTQEPRAKFKDVQFAPDLTNPGSMICKYLCDIDPNQIITPDS